jgi:hypothetical protein
VVSNADGGKSGQESRNTRSFPDQPGSKITQAVGAGDASSTRSPTIVGSVKSRDWSDRSSSPVQARLSLSGRTMTKGDQARLMAWPLKAPRREARPSTPARL